MKNDFSGDEMRADAIRELHSETIAAFVRAREEAESWARVYEAIRRTAVVELRAAGLSYGQIATTLNLSKPRVTRILTADLVGSDGKVMQADWGDAEQRRFDDAWIAAGAHSVASPAGQHRHGLITAAERARLDAELDRAHRSIPAQLRQAVEAHPGQTAPDLLPHMQVAVRDAATVRFDHHVDAAHVAVDDRGRYWPTVTAEYLVPGDRVPRRSPPTDEWVTITNIQRTDRGITQIDFALDDGLTSQWYTVPDGERYPVDRSTV